jgi:hypothetical protein
MGKREASLVAVVGRRYDAVAVIAIAIAIAAAAAWADI